MKKVIIDRPVLRKNPNKIDTWIDDATLAALEAWMKVNNRTKADAIRVLLVHALGVKQDAK